MQGLVQVVSYFWCISYASCLLPSTWYKTSLAQVPASIYTKKLKKSVPQAQVLFLYFLFNVQFLGRSPIPADSPDYSFCFGSIWAVTTKKPIRLPG